MAFLPIIYTLSLFSVLFACACARARCTEWILWLKTNPKKCDDKKETRRKKNQNKTKAYVTMYAQFTQWINDTSFTGTLHFISFPAPNLSSNISFLCASNSVERFFIHVNFSIQTLYTKCSAESLSLVIIRCVYLLFAAPTISSDDVSSLKAKIQAIHLSIFFVFNFTHKIYSRYCICLFYRIRLNFH